jgi:hypothetical protein
MSASAVGSPAPNFPETDSVTGSPVPGRATQSISRVSVSRQGREAQGQSDGDETLKNFFQSLLVNKGK